ncbi:MAG: elongation factor 1-beta, partial [Candidatus Aenigmarchaeota archaeon]|nr:elongation factor 1-beta [Candidatus Aenigmarchaeota archaeon]
MGKVLATIKVMPDGLEVDINKLEEEIKQKINPERINKQPIAFGLVALIVEKVIADDEGEIEKVENALKSIEGVSSIEV